jgi:hypothetical protein
MSSHKCWVQAVEAMTRGALAPRISEGVTLGEGPRDAHWGNPGVVHLTNPSYPKPTPWILRRVPFTPPL